MRWIVSTNIPAVELEYDFAGTLKGIHVCLMWVLTKWYLLEAQGHLINSWTLPHTLIVSTTATNFGTESHLLEGRLLGIESDARPTMCPGQNDIHFLFTVGHWVVTGGYVFISVSSFVCLFTSRIIHKLLHRFTQNSLERQHMDQWRND